MKIDLGSRPPHSATPSSQVATAPESVLSARAAVADFGFEYTLGNRNVSMGTDFHKVRACAPCTTVTEAYSLHYALRPS